MKTAANREIRAFWNGTCILQGMCSTVMGCQIIRGLADDFAGKSHYEMVEKAEKLSARLLNEPNSSCTFEHSDETGAVLVEIR